MLMDEQEKTEINAQIEKAFTYHSPTYTQAKQYETIRAEAKRLAYLIYGLCPNSREKSLALTALDSTVMWANASIARND